MLLAFTFDLLTKSRKDKIIERCKYNGKYQRKEINQFSISHTHHLSKDYATSFINMMLFYPQRKLSPPKEKRPRGLNKILPMAAMPAAIARYPR